LKLSIQLSINTCFLIMSFFYSLPPLISEIFFSLLLGVIQGVAEFLPISSTAHLLLTSKLLVGKDIGLTASNIIQFGTLVAIIQYYWAELKAITLRLLELVKSPAQWTLFARNIKLWWQGKMEQITEKGKIDVTIIQVIIATLPIVVFALATRKLVEGLRDNLLWIATFLVLGGIMVAVAEVISHYREVKHKSPIMSKWEVLTIGLFQCLSVFSGVSRSGSTMSGALVLDRPRYEAMRFSFFLSIPALGLASLYDTIKGVRELFSGQMPLLPGAVQNGATYELSLVSLLIGFLVAYFVGLTSLKWLLKYLGQHDSRYFIIYRLLLAALIVFLFWR
jgi:undecaprenyl-diphosphatase